jgi:hypothetical protein
MTSRGKENSFPRRFTEEFYDVGCGGGRVALHTHYGLLTANPERHKSHTKQNWVAKIMESSSHDSSTGQAAANFRPKGKSDPQHEVQDIKAVNI